MTDSTLRSRIVERLRLLGLSGRAASEQAGLGESAVRDILQNEDLSPRLVTIQKLAVALETTVEWLACGADAPAPGLRKPMTDLRKLALSALDEKADAETRAWRTTHFKDAANPQAIIALLDEIDSERESHKKTREALAQKDEAMGILFNRLNENGIDVSDLVS